MSLLPHLRGPLFRFARTKVDVYFALVEIPHFFVTNNLLFNDVGGPEWPKHFNGRSSGCNFPLPANRSESFNVLSPNCLQGLYNTKDYKPDPKYGSNIAFGNFLNQSASYSDLAQIGMMGLRGRSILGSSGDGGVGEICRANIGNNLGEGTPEFTPMFPSSCPYITSVGGTQSVGPEVAWNFSAGGFSNLFPVAWYQRQAVDSYLTDHIDRHAKEYYTNNNYVNFSGRGFPDVAAHSFYPE